MASKTLHEGFENPEQITTTKIMQIDIDQEMANRPLSKREKIALWILLTIFMFVCPATYTHQVKEFCAKIEELIK